MTTTYADREGSVASSEPVELYEFSRVVDGVTQKWLHANAETPVVFGGEVYNATPGLRRGSIAQNGESVSMQVEVDIPRMACITDELHGTITPAPIQLRILRWQRGLAETEVASLFNGEIAGSYFEGSMCHITGSSEESAWGDALGRTFCQRMCPHMLFDTLCGADKDAVTFTYKVTAISTDRLDVTVETQDNPADWLGAGSTKFVSGVLAQAGFHRYVVGQNANVVTLQLPLMDNVIVNDLLTLTAGCNRDRSDCKDVHNNIERFGGFPLMPDRSPWTSAQ